MLRLTLAVARKDLALTLARGSGLIQALLLGLLLLFVFSLSQGIGERMSPQAAAAVFWLSSAFCQVLTDKFCSSMSKSKIKSKESYYGHCKRI